MGGFNVPSPYVTRDDNSFTSNVESTRKHRFRIKITPNPQGDPILRQNINAISFYAKTCDTPSITFDELVVHNGQDKILMPGKWSLNPVNITFYDVIKNAGSVTQRLYEMIPNNTNFASRNSYYKFGMDIEALNGDDTVITRYKLYECYLEKYEPSNFDYSDSNISEVTMTVKYNRSEIFKIGDGI